MMILGPPKSGGREWLGATCDVVAERVSRVRALSLTHSLSGSGQVLVEETDTAVGRRIGNSTESRQEKGRETKIEKIKPRQARLAEKYVNFVSTMVQVFKSSRKRLGRQAPILGKTYDRPLRRLICVFCRGLLVERIAKVVRD